MSVEMSDGARPGQQVASALLVQDISKRFGGVQALSEVSLAVPVGQVTGLIGPNGAGKSTLLKIISGFLKPDSGSVAFDDVALTGRSAASVARAGVVATFQQATPVPGLSVAENILLGTTQEYVGGGFATVFGMPAVRARARTLRDRATEFLKDFHLTDVADEDAASLSFGQLRLLEIARALATEPRILLLDEPAAGLNRVEIDYLAQLIRRLRTESGIGVLVVDHDVPFVFGLCDRITAMNFGQVIAVGTPEEVENDERVRSAYLSVSSAASEQG